VTASYISFTSSWLQHYSNDVGGAVDLEAAEVDFGAFLETLSIPVAAVFDPVAQERCDLDALEAHLAQLHEWFESDAISRGDFSGLLRTEPERCHLLASLNHATALRLELTTPLTLRLPRTKRWFTRLLIAFYELLLNAQVKSRAMRVSRIVVTPFESPNGFSVAILDAFQEDDFGWLKADDLVDVPAFQSRKGADGRAGLKIISQVLRSYGIEYLLSQAGDGRLARVLQGAQLLLRRS
jgi:hypothetical protein